MKRIYKYLFLSAFVLTIASCNEDLDSLSFDFSENPTGDVVGGSLNKFSVSGDYLYIINDQSLVPFSLDNPAKPVPQNDIFLGIGIETLITKGDNLFIGAQNGMHIFDISNRKTPKFLSTYTHVVSCDPVAVQGDIAYVTLRSGSGCNRGQNSLDIVDISNLKRPREVKSINLTSPHGLAVDGEDLFVTNGTSGLTRFFLETPINPSETERLSNINTKDAIAWKDNLILTGNDGVYQYSYTDKLEFLSKISF